MYEFIKTIHIITVVLFVGTVFFRTFVLFKLGKYYPQQESVKIQKALGNEARKIIAISNIVLILSGFYLFFAYHLQNSSVILHIKIVLGLILVLAFLAIPKFLEKINAKPRFRVIFHYFYFILLLSVITLSQYI
ncbi:hypothetical protein [Arcobacter vandammei]|uniref:hypothetical protein n=1 Tax=Arcobacter vandammei TaxID=2782243 RepID=UPI0018DF7F95|nr:hypothetical protein [Arcobacter vandammei]